MFGGQHGNVAAEGLSSRTNKLRHQRPVRAHRQVQVLDCQAFVVRVQLPVRLEQGALAPVQCKAVTHPAQPAGKAQVGTAGGQHRDHRNIREKLADGLHDDFTQRALGR